MNIIIRKIITVVKNPRSLLYVPIYKFSKYIKNDVFYLKCLYLIRMGKILDLNCPKLFSEKLQWLKLNHRKPIFHTMVDKYDVKKYISDKIGEQYAIPTLGLWNRFEEIDFAKLSDKFILKCTHDCGSYYICKDKSSFDYEKCKTKINKGLQRNQYLLSREWPYKDLKRRIIAEPLLQDHINEFIIDYKFYCFNGDPKMLYIGTNRGKEDGLCEDFFDINGNHLEIRQKGYKNNSDRPNLPVNFNKMIELSKILSKETIHLRVDFYEINNQIYVGELTFFDGGGLFQFEPKKYDRIVGDWLELPIKKNN